MVNKKGFIRTLEAVIAIIIILGIIFYITPTVAEFEEEVPEDVVNAKEFILNQILSNKEYGECILNADPNKICGSALVGECKENLIDNLIEKNIPAGYDHACEVCESSVCGKAKYPLDKSIYTNSIFIYKKDKNYNVMRIYIWKA